MRGFWRPGGVPPELGPPQATEPMCPVNVAVTVEHTSPWISGPDSASCCTSALTSSMWIRTFEHRECKIQTLILRGILMRLKWVQHIPYLQLCESFLSRLLPEVWPITANIHYSFWADGRWWRIVSRQMVNGHRAHPSSDELDHQKNLGPHKLGRRKWCVNGRR